MSESNQAGQDRPLPAFLQQPLAMLVNGEWTAAASGETIEVVDPSTGRVFAHIPAAGAEDVERAVKSARQAFEKGSWSRMSAIQRERILWKLSDLFEAHLKEIVELEILDNGMPISLITRAVERAIDGVRYYAGMCTKLHGVTSELSGQRAEFHAYSLLEPVGVAALIVPWNSPFSAACNKIAPALAAGCSAILKPAEQTSLSALLIGKLALEAGIPPGVLNVLTGHGHVAGALLAEHPDVDKVSFTGSTEVGKRLVQASAGNLKRLTLELGGKSPVFVFDDADMEIAIPAAARAIFSNSGQICYAGSRLYVQRKSYEKVLAGVAEVGDRLRMGDSFDKKTELGPLISARQHQRVLQYIDDGIAQGAALVTGGRATQGEGYYVRPTVFDNPDPGLALVREEVFGPVLSAMPFDSIEQVPALANATPYGLGAGVFTRDISTAHLVAKRIRTGNVWVNFYGGADKSLPFGGYKQSGWGREGGVEGIEAFLEKKAVYVRL